MNHVIAYELLAAELATYRSIDFEQLRQHVGGSTSHLKRAGNGVEYEISVIVRWCNREEGDIHVFGAICEAAWGGPHDSVDDSFIVPRQVASHAYSRSRGKIPEGSDGWSQQVVARETRQQTTEFLRLALCIVNSPDSCEDR